MAAESSLERGFGDRQRERLSRPVTYATTVVSSRGARLLGAGPVRLQLYPPTVYRNLPDQRLRFLTTDARGFRGPAVPAAKTGKPRIVLVGGSTAFGYGLAADTQTLAALVGAELGAEVVNAAVIGHQSGQELAYLSAELMALEPDVVIAFDGWNDLVAVFEPGFRERPAGFNTFNGIFEDLGEMQALLGMPVRRRLLMLHRFLFWRALGSISKQERRAELAAPRAAREDVASAAEVYARNVRSMERVARAGGARFLWVLQPVPRDQERGARPQAYARFRALAEERLKTGGLEPLDLAREQAPFTYFDQIHLDAEGTAAAARLVAARIRSAGLLRRAR